MNDKNFNQQKISTKYDSLPMINISNTNSDLKNS